MTEEQFHKAVEIQNNIDYSRKFIKKLRNMWLSFEGSGSNKFLNSDEYHLIEKHLMAHKKMLLEEFEDRVKELEAELKALIEA